MPKMKVAVFVEPGRIVLDEKPVPDIGPLDALVRVTTTTICSTDVHILKGEYPVARGLTIGHEPVGVIEKLGSAVQGYREGQRVIAGAITPSGHSAACLCGYHSQDGAGTRHGWKPLGWRFGNTIDGCQAEYVRVPDAMANLAPVPDGLTDEQVLMCRDIMSTGFSGAESGRIRIGDTVAVFAQGPIGLCATAGARLMGATTIIAVESVLARMEMARRMGADHVVDFSKADPVESFQDCLYFSVVTYTSLGFGDQIPVAHARLIAGVEALNGLLLIGWTASFTYLAMERYWPLHARTAPRKQVETRRSIPRSASTGIRRTLP